VGSQFWRSDLKTKSYQIYMQCEQSQSTSVQCSFCRLLFSLEFSHLTQFHHIWTKLNAANTNRLHCLKMILQGRCIPDISITSNQWQAMQSLLFCFWSWSDCTHASKFHSLSSHYITWEFLAVFISEQDWCVF